MDVNCRLKNKDLGTGLAHYEAHQDSEAKH